MFVFKRFSWGVAMKNQNSWDLSVFHEKELPESGSSLVGYAALVKAYNLKVLLPERCSAISQRHKRYETNEWMVYTPRHRPKDTLAGHLTFALKYEGVDLAVLKALFAKIDPEEIVAWVQAEPVGRYSRRTWFFYEWLMGKPLGLPDANLCNFVDAIDPRQQCPGPSVPSRRHRVRNNLPGVPDFCPLVRYTEKIKQYENLGLSAIAHTVVAQTHQDLLVRASAFLLLKDSRASFQIEQENPTQRRAERWGQALGLAGNINLSKEEILRLQTIVLEESRFISLGFRKEGGFVGVHDRLTGAPMPDHISSRPEDIERLLDGMIAIYQQLKTSKTFDPVILAAMISFGFVFIHPLVDGNGRIHRYLMQHVLAEMGFVPQGIVFPFSAVILKRIGEYRQVLEAYSSPRLKCIEWRSTSAGNVEVLNETIDLYRYFDATKQAEFLYDCIHQAVTKSFPEEIDYLVRYDQMKVIVKERFAMSDSLIHLLIRFLEQNNGVLSKRARSDEFKMLSSDECQQLEVLYGDIFKK